MLIIFSILGCVGCALCTILNFYVVLIGRIIYGLSNGVVSTSAIRFIDETCPGKHYGIGIALWVSFQNVGAFIAMMSGLLLPDDDSPEYATSNLWRYVFGFPITCYVIAVAIILAVVRLDTPKFMVM